MASTTFINNVTLTDAAWFNDVNTLVYILAGDGTNAATTDQLVRTNLSINNLTEDTGPDPAADYIETYDASAGTAKKVLVSRIGGITSMGVVASTSGTNIDFTGIPAGVKRISILFNGVSLSGTDNILVQLGDSGGIETSGYISGGTYTNNGAAIAGASTTAGFIVPVFAAGNSLTGKMTLDLLDATTFTWISSHAMGISNASSQGGGSKATSAQTDRVRITVSGVNTFDLGSIQVTYE